MGNETETETWDMIESQIGWIENRWKNKRNKRTVVCM